MVIRPALVFALGVSMLFDIWMLEHACTSGQFGTDFAVFWHAANSASPYAPSAAPFANPPTALLMFQPLRLAPFWACFTVATLASLAAFLWSAARLYGRDAALLALLSPAVVHCLIAGQLSLIVAALLFLAFLSSAGTRGALLAIAVCLKPQICFLAPLLFLFTRQWRALAWFAVIILLFCAAATLTFGVPIWAAWQSGVANLFTVAAERGALWLSVSPAGFGVPRALGFIAGAASLLALRKAPPQALAAILAAASLLAAPYALTYDLAAVAPLAALTLVQRRGGEAWAAALAFSAVFGPTGPLGALIAAWRRPAERADSAI